MRPTRLTLPASLLLSVLTLAGCATPPADTDSADRGDAAETARAPAATIDIAAFAEREVFEPQLVSEYDDGTLLMVWRQKGESGFDLFAARHTGDGSFSEPTRINDEPGTVYGYPHDEMRASVATAPDGQLAIVWSDARSQVRGAFGSEHGEQWSSSIRLDQGEVPAYRGFPAAGIDRDGALNAVWIDSRHAPKAGAEEPADLYYARVSPGGIDWGQVEEINLTADQEATVCGCCKPDLEILPYGRLRALFRNADDEGYRDIWAITGDPASGFEDPQRVGPPTWKITGCPMTGPAGLERSGVEAGVMYREASSGSWALKVGSPGSEDEALVFPDGVGDWKMTLSPRAVAASPELLLVPGQPGGRLLERDGEAWSVLRDDVPPWATSAAAVNGGVLVVGAVDGELEAEILAVSSG